MFKSGNLAWRGLFLLALAQSSCVESVNPFVPPEESELDKQLLGTWKPHEVRQKGVAKIVIAPATGINKAPAGLVEVRFFLEEPGKDIGVEKPLYAFCGKVGDEHYLHHIVFAAGNAPPEWNKPAVIGYSIWKYALADDRLMIWLMDEEVRAKLIDGGKLKGSIALKLNGSREVTLSESAEGLRKFLKEGGDKVLYPDKAKAELRRVK